MKKIICALVSAAICSTWLPIAQAYTVEPPSELHVEGRYIYNAKGEQVRLIGANIPDLQWATGGDNDLNRRVDMLCDQWNANSVRLAVHSKFWFGEEWYQNNNYTGYRKKVDEVIKRVNAKGKYVILNLHEFYAITEKNKLFWEDIVQVYKNNPGVLFGLLNEPHDISWDVWRNGGYITVNNEFGKPQEMKVYGHQQILEMIRQAGARNIILAGGLDWSYYFNGITKGYDGLEYGYRLQEPEGPLKGNGIIYDTHIYPMKPEYNPVERAISCVVDEVPILVGEVGHWGERLFDWYDNYLCEYPYIWLNQVHDYIDRNQLNYSMWSFHIGAAPAMFTNYETFEPTLHSGYAQKHRMISDPDNRPPEDQRTTEDPSPLSTWEHTIDFENNEKFLVYGDAVRAQLTDDGYEGSGLLVSFDMKQKDINNSAAIYKFAEGTDFSGAKWVSVRIKGDGDLRNVGFGIELSDGRQFVSRHPLDLFENWKLLFLPITTFKGLDVLDTTKISSFFLTSLDEGVGSFIVDNIVIAGLPYEKIDTIVSDATEGDKLIWNAWEDSESKLLDSFTIEQVTGGKATNSSVVLRYNRPLGSYGGQARARVPNTWSPKMRELDYFTFWAKGDGTDQKLTIRFDCDRGTTFNEQRSNFKKREFERFAVDVEITGKDWKFYKIPFDYVGLNDILHKDRIRFISFFNRIDEKSGTVTINDFAFTNILSEMKGNYSTHEPPRKSLPIDELKTKFPKDEIIQFPRDFEVTVGQDELIHIHLMNKTNRDARGEFKIEGLPMPFDETAKYDSIAGYVSYPHYPWRNYSYTNFKIKIPPGMEGEYTVTVSDISGNGILPQEYKLIAKPPTLILE